MEDDSDQDSFHESTLRPDMVKVAYLCAIRKDLHTRAELNIGHGGLSDTRTHVPNAHYCVVKSLDEPVQWFLFASDGNRNPRLIIHRR